MVLQIVFGRFEHGRRDIAGNHIAGWAYHDRCSLRCCSCTRSDVEHPMGRRNLRCLQQGWDERVRCAGEQLVIANRRCLVEWLIHKSPQNTICVVTGRLLSRSSRPASHRKLSLPAPHDCLASSVRASQCAKRNTVLDHARSSSLRYAINARFCRLLCIVLSRNRRQSHS